MPTSPPSLSLQALNRATLARQLLLERESVTPLRAVQRLAGLQAQLPRPPHLGLWTRLEGYDPKKLSRLVVQRKVVRAPLMRCTLHLVTATDFLAMRGSLQPALTRAMKSALRGRMDGVDLEAVVKAARAHLRRNPGTFEDIRGYLADVFPNADHRALGYAVRTQLPLILVPEDQRWSYPASSDFSLAEEWLDSPVELTDARPHELVKRYLAAFGPATPKDAQTWSGLGNLRETFEELRPRLSVLRDEKGRELFDLPRAPRPHAKVRAPVRYLPDFDNLVLAHDDRSRLLDEAHLKKVSLPNLRVLPTFLVDGRVAGTWKTEATKKVARLQLTSFADLTAKSRRELEKEGELLLAFVAPEITTREVRFV